MSTSEIFGKNLKKIRKDLKLNQEKFAELLDIQTRSLSDIENGKYLPTPSNIDKICNKLGVSVKNLFDEEEKNIDSKKNEIIRLINLKLKILSENQLEIIYNIVNNAFK